MVALTQDAAGAADWQQMLAAAGMDTLAWPAFDVVAEPDAAVLQVFGRETMAAAQAAEAPLCVVLPSPAAVRLLAAALQRAGRPWPAGVWAAVPGAGSARVFRTLIDRCDVLLVPPPPGQDAAHLARFSGLSGILLRNCMVRVRMASLINTTRMSVTIASSILRMVSACWARSSGVARLSTRINWVSFCTSSIPRTSSATGFPHFSATVSNQLSR